MKQYFIPILFSASVLVSCSSKQEKAAAEDKKASVPEATVPTKATAGNDTIVGPKGAASAKITESGSNKTFTYGNYTVKTSQAADGGGDKITVTNANKETWDIPFVEMSFFHGISGDYLLIDEGSSDIMRKVHIYDLKTKKEIAVVQSDDDESIEGGKLTFYTLIQAKKIKKLPACPEAAEWKKNGLDIGYVQKRVVELLTGKITTTEEFKCRALS